MVLVLDTSQAQIQQSYLRARRFCRDLLENLPAYVGSEVFRLGDASHLIPFDPFRSDSLAELSSHDAGGGEEMITLQRALTEAEKMLCRQPAEKDFPGRALILIGGGTEEKALALRSSCNITLFVISTTSEVNLPLQQLAVQSQGEYYSLAKTRGYEIASDIRKKIGIASVRRMMDRYGRDDWKTPLLWSGGWLAISLVGLLFLIFQPWKGCHESRPAPVVWREESAPALLLGASSDPPESAFLEAKLKICTPPEPRGTFRMNSREPVIVGGKRYASYSPAQLLIDDPMVASEHCQIHAEGDTFFVVDLGSSQGTFVNDERIGRKALADGDRLRVGETVLEFTRDPSPPT